MFEELLPPLGSFVIFGGPEDVDEGIEVDVDECGEVEVDSGPPRSSITAVTFHMPFHEVVNAFWQVPQAAKSDQVTVPQIQFSSYPFHGPGYA